MTSAIPSQDPAQGCPAVQGMPRAQDPHGYHSRCPGGRLCVAEAVAEVGRSGQMGVVGIA